MKTIDMTQTAPITEGAILHYQQYLKSAVFADQTDLVISMLQVKRRLKIKRIHNLYSYDAVHGKTKKFILQWLLVAPWFANVLLNKKEVVFNVCGCSFWGTVHGQDKDETLRSIYEHITHFDRTENA